MNEITFSRDDAPLGTPRVTVVDAANGAAEQRTVPLVTQYLRIAFRWRWLILGAIAIALLLGLVATLLTTPLYTATTRIEINREANRVVNVDDVQPKTSPVDVEFYQTQYGLLKSRSLAERVVRQLRLADNRAFFETMGGAGAFEEAARGASTAKVARERRSSAAASILLGNVDISPIRGSRLVDIRWTSPDAGLSARIANAWADGFIESNLERRFDATAYARRFLEQRLDQLRQKLEESERQLVAYASNQAIINVPVPGADAAGHSQERSLTADSLAAMNSELASATADRIRAESRLREASGGAVSEALSNPAIATLRQRRAELAADYSRMMAQFEPDYPPAQQLQAQVKQIDRSLAREEQRVQSTLRNAYQDSVRREQELKQQVEGLKSNFLDQRRRSIQYNIFQREVDTNRELYNGLLQRYKEIGVAAGVGTNNVSVVDPAQIPKAPSRPRPLVNLFLALVAGVLAGVGLALVREQIDETVADPADLESRLGLPLLGAIPKFAGDSPLVELKDPKSDLVEAYLSVQINLAFSTDHGFPRTLAVTSTRPAEGKSTTAYAIAYTVARNGARTLLIDGDMRSPSIHFGLGLTNARGLSNYLAGTDDLAGLIQRPEGEPFAVLTTGPQPPNAADLLRSDRFQALLDELLAQFDHVVIDSPPVMGLADAPIIASRTEGTIFVVEAHGVKARVARLAIGRLRQGRAQMLGTVLTKFDFKRAHFGYGYDYGYGYGYGYGAENGKKKTA